VQNRIQLLGETDGLGNIMLDLRKTLVIV